MTGTPDDEQAGDRAYFRLPGDGWPAILPAVHEQLVSTQRTLDAILEPAGPRADAPTPAEFAIQLGGLATALFDELSPHEHALRQVITTLRTGLALCWDMYGADETARVSVAAHMRRLQEQIDDFERELLDVQVETATDDADGTST